MPEEQKQQSTLEAAGYIAGVGLGATRSAFRGKPISASIIVLAGAILLVGGSHLQHGDSSLFVQVIGCVVTLFGLGGWIFSLKER